jgi:tRNA G18 (ribose-2'-O)-methylase SpoU
MLRREERYENVFLLIGNESQGIRPEHLEKATERVRIPGSGGAESLNAAVAAGIILYALTS